MFLDETAASTNMARRYGRAPRGERCRIAVPCGHYKTITVTAALRATGFAATALRWSDKRHALAGLCQGHSGPGPEAR